MLNKYLPVSRHWLLRLSIVLIVLSLLLTSCQVATQAAIPSATSIAAAQSPTPAPTRTEMQIATSAATSTMAPLTTSKPAETATQIKSPTPSAINTTVVTTSPNTAGIKTVFIIVMENHNWSDIMNNPSAPYINQTLLPQASYALNYHNPPGNHPSEPNYLWLEAGTNLGIHNDDSPQKNHQNTTDHLVTYLNNAGINWKAYQEGISGTVCPLDDNFLYAPKHNPMVYFDDVTNNNDPNYAYCITHERPFTELVTDLENNTVAQYNFITPNLCDDMHNSVGCDTLDEVKNGDTWLSEQVPMILASSAYQQGGVLFITWDEADDDDQPIGMIVLSPLAKGDGYTNSIHYTHSSTLRTVQEIFNITPFLGDAANATDLSDLFTKFP